MKKIMIAVVVFCYSFTGSTAQSMLKVRLADSSQFNVSLDGRYFNRQGTSITVGDLPPGPHFLKIFGLRLDRWGRGHEEEIFEGKVKTHNGMATLFVYDYNNDQTNISEVDMSNFPVNHPPHNNGQRFRDQYFDDNGDNGNGNNGNNDNGYRQPPAPVNTGTLTQGKMDDLKTQVSGKATDVEKTALLKDALKNEKITTRQVADIMDWFIFESSKVDFAKWAYSITIDKEYFTDLENKFSYKESQDDLDQFIKSQK